MIQFNFNFLKTVQASKVLLKHRSGRMEYIRLLKMLYIVDRELLVETGRTLTGDSPVAMKNGPVLSNVYDLIKGVGNDAEAWKTVIDKDGYDLVLKESELGIGKLNTEELEKLNDINARFADSTSEDLVELTHEFAEWISAFDPSNPTSSNSILWEAAIVAQGQEELTGEIEADLQWRNRAAETSC